MKVLKIIFPFFYGLITFIGFGFIAFVIIDQFLFPFNYIVGIVILILAYFAGRLVFLFMLKRGVLGTFSGANESPDLDNIVSSSIIVFENLEESDGIKNTLNLNFINKPCKISIWGDYNGKSLASNLNVGKIELFESEKILSISFKGGNQLKIKNPSKIHVTSSYLKVIKSSEILWKDKQSNNSFHEYSYKIKNGKIITQSNTNWRPHRYDLGIGKNPLYIQF